MRVALLGGTGTAGTPLAAELAGRGHDVRLLSRSAPSQPRAGVGHVAVDVTTGDGLAAGLDGVDAVVNAVDARKHAEEVLVEGTRRVAEAAARVGVGHVVGLSIIGCDRVPISYYRVKTAQEEAIRAGAVPWSILRANQFHELLATIFAAAARARVVPAGRLPLQPVAAADVATALADIVERGPSGDSALAGPRVERLGDLARTWREATGTRAVPVPVPLVAPALRAISRGGLCDAASPRGSVTFADWLRRP
jgi:uncharacterized protein YbjT (DUF2867 family)